MTILIDSSLNKKSFRTLPVTNKRVLVRVDYNVPIDEKGLIRDNSRIVASLPTLEYLIEKKAKIILISHLGRPKGQPNPKYTLRPVVEVLSQLLKEPVAFADDCIGPQAYEAVARLKPGDVLLLENLRFHAEEEKNNSVFAKELASFADYFVQDAFGAVHRAHASTSSIPQHLVSGAGALLEKELKFLSQIRSQAAHPYLTILGGAKVSDKIGVVESFMEQADTLFIGGAMAYTFLKANNIDVGDSRFEPDFLDFCNSILSKAEEKHVNIILPQDHLVVQNIDNPQSLKGTEGASIQSGWKGVDIGPKTLQALISTLRSSRTIFWNGPVGVFEIPSYSRGTMEIAKITAEVAQKGTTVVIGGGDSAAAATQAGVNDKVTFISTGGGASLEFLEGKELPGVKVLPNA